jgi:hypothetical protein
MKTTKIAITEDGKVFREQFESEEITITDAALEALAEGLPTTIQNAFAVGGINVSIVKNKQDIYCTLELSVLPLKAPYAVVGDGILAPSFGATNQPILDLKWTPPEGMRIKLLVLVASNGTGALIKEQWLMVFDAERRCYRLPSGNLYDDARLCNGAMLRTHPTIQAAVQAELVQLEKGQWNGDLNTRELQASELFRFKPTNETFEQQPPLKLWADLCDKINPAIIKHVVL